MLRSFKAIKKAWFLHNFSFIFPCPVYQKSIKMRIYADSINFLVEVNEIMSFLYIVIQNISLFDQHSSSSPDYIHVPSFTFTVTAWSWKPPPCSDFLVLTVFSVLSFPTCAYVPILYPSFLPQTLSSLVQSLICSTSSSVTAEALKTLVRQSIASAGVD